MQAQATLTSSIIANIFDGHAALCPSYKSNDVNQIASLTRQEILGDMFYTGSLGYFAQLLAISKVSEISNNAHYEMAAGYGTFGYEPNVDYIFGLPIGIRAGGISLDIPMNVVIATNDGNKENKKNFTIQSGILMSALEHSTPEQMFNDPANPTEAISAVKALQKASAAGQRIYQITQANIDSVMPSLNLGVGTLNEIRASVAAGLEVITHTDPVSVPGYTGEGYIILDPETGSGAYKIGGGLNGGAFVAGFLIGHALNFLALLIGPILFTPIGLAMVVIVAGLFAIAFQMLSKIDRKYYGCASLGMLAAGVLSSGLAYTGAFLIKHITVIVGSFTADVLTGVALTSEMFDPSTCEF